MRVAPLLLDSAIRWPSQADTFLLVDAMPDNISSRQARLAKELASELHGHGGAVVYVGPLPEIKLESFHFCFCLLQL